MAYNGFKVHESDLCMLYHGLNIEYGGDLNHIGFNPGANIGRFAESTSIKLHMSDRNEGKDFAREISNFLKENIPVLIFVNTGGLTYNNVYSSNISRYHMIILHGIDEEAGTAYVSDPHIRDYTGQMMSYQGPAKLSEIEACTYRYMWADCRGVNDISTENIRQIGLGHIKEFLSGAGGRENIYCGKNALDKFLLDLPELQSLGDEEFLATCLNINYNIKITSFCYCLEYIKTFFDEHRDILGTDGTAGALEELEKLKVEWNKLSLNILKAGKMRKKERIPEICGKAKEAMDIQNGTLARIITLADSKEEDSKPA
jgi:hypothetical protein